MRRLVSKNNILSIVISLVFSFAMSFLLVWAGEKCAVAKPWLSLIADIAPEWYMNTFYSTFANPDDPGSRYGDVTFFDLSENATRKDIADVIHLVSQYSPRVIGVDFTFPKSENYDSAKTAYLIQTINNLPPNIPVVFAHDTALSAIPDSVIKKHHLGNVDFFGFYNFKTQVGPIPHIAIKMAELAGYDTHHVDSSSFIVNYTVRQKGSTIINCPLSHDDSLTISKHTPNKMVLIGTTTDDRDYIKLPFKKNNKEEYIAGSRIIRAMLISILSTDAPNNSLLHAPINRYFSKVPQWISWSIVIAYALFYLIVYCITDNLLKPLIQKHKLWTIPTGFLKSILSFIFIVLLLIISMRITYTFHIVPDVISFLYMAVFMSYSYELFKIKKEEPGEGK